MLFLINIHWRRLEAEAGRPPSGNSTYPANARNYKAAERKAKVKFLRKYGNHLEITRMVEFQDPAGIFQPSTDGGSPRIDCGSGHSYGTCPKCGLAHGHVLMMAGRPLLTNA